MIFFIRKKFAILLIIFLLALSGHSQQVFFKSGQAFTSEQLSTFYSSISTEGDILLFSANDYSLYPYNKPDGRLKWTSETSYKSNTPPFISGKMIMAGVYENKLESAATMDTATGKLTVIQKRS
jgi:outer membrane protein assembly factor BamB